MTLAVRPGARAKQGTILVVEDEVRAQRLLRLNLEPLGYRVITVDRAATVADAVESYAPDLVVLDVLLPDGNGFDVCQQIRAISNVPVIFLSAYGQAADKARALELGGDDYVTKPYDPIELSARIEAVLRRTQGRQAEARQVYHYGSLCIDPEQRLVLLDGVEIHLSRTEYRLLECLAMNAGRTLVADALLAKVWGPEYVGDYASLHLYISRLRRKLRESSSQPRFIITKPGIGYMMPAGSDLR